MSTEAKTSRASKEETAKKREMTTPAIQHVLTPEGAPPMMDLQRAVADPRTARSPQILALQRNYGNEAVQRLLVGHNLQAKLTVGPVNDTYEQEADRVAAQVMSMPTQAPDVQRLGEEEEKIQAKPLAASITPLIQRQRLPEEEEKPLQGKFTLERETFDPGTDFESRLAETRGSGRPLPKTIRDFMEQRFGTDFSGVHLHTGSESAQLNRDASAQAFTRGQDIYLGEGKEDVESSAGKQLLAHELTHVIQQSGRGNAVQRLATFTDPKWAGVVEEKSAKQEAAKQALEYAKELVTFAQAGILASNADNIRRFNEWFGGWNAGSGKEGRRGDVFSNYGKIFSRLSGTVDFYVDLTQPSVFAYVYVGGATRIYLCGAFFSSYKDKATIDATAGVIIHELSHLCCGTKDFAYGQQPSKDLVITTPDQSIKNADTYEYFCECFIH